MSIFKGAGVALITPMNEDNTINYGKLEELLEEQIAAGTDAILPVGTTGEATTLSEEEHIEVIRFTVKVVNHRVPVIPGTGSNSTEKAITLSRKAEKIGADGVLLVSPYYNKATQKGLIQHYKKIAKSIDIPCILYNVPSRTGVEIEPETIAQLYYDVENIVGVKDAAGNIGASTYLMSLVDEKFGLYSGNDDQIVPLLSIGGLGVISVLSNIAPERTHRLCQMWFDGNSEMACKEQLRAMGVIKALFSEVNPIPVKAAMNLMGKEVGALRLPLTEMEVDHLENLKQELKNYGIL